MWCQQSAGRFAPCARQSLRNSIQDRARRSKRHQKPEKNAKYVAVYGNHSMRQGLTDNFRRWHIADLYACPYVQSLARTLNIGEVMTEFSKAEREIQNDNIPRKSEQKMQTVQRDVNQRGSERPGQRDA